jgi:hypothetical protein
MFLNHAQYVEFIARNIEGATAAAAHAQGARGGFDINARDGDGYLRGFLDFMDRIDEQPNCDIAATLSTFTAELRECIEIAAADVD